MPEDNGVVRRIAWREICPWLMIFRSFRLAISLPVLSLATLGWLLTPLGPMIGGALFLEVHDNPQWLPAIQGIEELSSDGNSVNSSLLLSLPNPVLHVYRHFATPFIQIFDRGNTINETAYHVTCGLWNIVVWALFAGAITRITAVRLGRDERVDLRSAFSYAVKQYCWSGMAPLFPLFGVLLAGAAISLLGAFMRLDLGVAVAGVLWPVVLVGGLIMAVLLLGLAAGWPLMWPTISSEEHGDAFEAFSRSFSYVFQRPLHYLFYSVVALVFGGLCWVLVSAFANALIELCWFAVNWGAGAERVDAITHYTDQTGMLWLGGGLMHWFNSLVRLIVVAFNFSFFFCIATAIYLLLRRAVDQTDFDEVYLEDHGRFSLPPLDANVPRSGAEPSASAAGSTATPEHES